MGIFNVLNSFLTASFYFVMLNNLFFTSEIYFLVFLIVMEIKGIWPCVPHIYNPVEQKVIGWTISCS